MIFVIIWPRVQPFFFFFFFFFFLDSGQAQLFLPKYIYFTYLNTKVNKILKRGKDHKVSILINSSYF
jgi:hypothetical protein